MLKKKISKLLVSLALFAGLFGLIINNPTSVSATSREDFYGVCDDIEDDDVKKLAGCTEASSKNKNVVDIIQSGVNVVISLVGILAVFSIIYGGFTYMTAQSDPAKIKRGKDMVIYAVVALAVAFLAYGIVLFVTRNLK